MTITKKSIHRMQTCLPVCNILFDPFHHRWLCIQVVHRDVKEALEKCHQQYGHLVIIPLYVHAYNIHSTYLPTCKHAMNTNSTVATEITTTTIKTRPQSTRTTININTNHQNCHHHSHERHNQTRPQLPPPQSTQTKINSNTNHHNQTRPQLTPPESTRTTTTPGSGLRGDPW